jgi:threonine aldolase
MSERSSGLSSMTGYEFASDNAAGILPEVAQAWQQANVGYAAAYGNDPWTQKAIQCIRDFFECQDAEVYFVFNGTGANVLSLAGLCQRHEHVIAHAYSHLECDEAQAPEFFGGGLKVKTVGGPGERAKITERALQSSLEVARARSGEVHYAPPGAISITQSTELGAIYTVDEIAHLTEMGRSVGARVHMDGARFFYALERLRCKPADLTWRAGVDVLSLGGTKIGMGPTEAIVVFHPEKTPHLRYLRKQGAQLASKMRFLSAPWVPLLEQELWKQASRHACLQAQSLAQGLQSRGIELLAPPEVNAVFARLSQAQQTQLEQAGWHVYPFQEGTTRLMTSWATQPEWVEGILKILK